MLEIRMVNVGIAISDQMTKKALPPFDVGAKSPYPMVSRDVKAKYKDSK